MIPGRIWLVSWRALSHAALGTAWLLLLAAAPAIAHGPCGCLTPSTVRPGDIVRVHNATLRVVWNPGRRELAIGPRPLWREQQRGQPSHELLRRRSPAKRSRFRVPEAPPGRYLIAVFDGTEGGAHYTWERVWVLPAKRRADRVTVFGVLFWVTVPVGAAAYLAEAVLLRRRRP